MTDFEKARDDAAETRGYRQCSTGQKSLDAAIRWYLEIGFQDGANWAKSFLQSDIDKLQKENEELKLAFQSLQSGFDLDKLEKEINQLKKECADAYANGYGDQSIDLQRAEAYGDQRDEEITSLRESLKLAVEALNNHQNVFCSVDSPTDPIEWTSQMLSAVEASKKALATIKAKHGEL
jgi:FtsZ-binding cell division protein ZapB